MIKRKTLLYVVLIMLPLHLFSFAFAMESDEEEKIYDKNGKPVYMATAPSKPESVSMDEPEISNRKDLKAWWQLMSSIMSCEGDGCGRQRTHNSPTLYGVLTCPCWTLIGFILLPGSCMEECGCPPENRTGGGSSYYSSSYDADRGWSD